MIGVNMGLNDPFQIQIMAYDLVDEFQIEELGGHDVKGLGKMDLIEVSSRPQTARVRF